MAFPRFHLGFLTRLCSRPNTRADARSGARACAALLLAGLVLAGVASADNQFFWYRYDVDSNAAEQHDGNKGATFGYNALRADVKGNLKIAYRGHYNIKYSELKNHIWYTEIADDSTGSGARMDMALDPDGEPHMVFHNDNYGKALYSARKNGVWKRKVLTELKLPNLDFYQVSIAVNKDFESHCVFTSAGAGNYANTTYVKVGKDGAATDPVKVFTGGINGKWNSVTTDASGKPVISLFIFDRNNLGVATKNDSGFTTQWVDSGDYDNAHGFLNTIQPSADSFFVSYLNQAHACVQIAHGKPGGAWTVERVDTLPAWTIFSSQIRMVIDSKGNPILAYPLIKKEDEYAALESRLVITYKKAGSWVREVVDSSGIAGENLTMTILPNDMPALAYWESGTKTLRVAVGSLTAPPDEDKNGIPDYKEVKPIALRRFPIVAERPVAYPFFDALGRSMGSRSAVSNAPTAGRGNRTLVWPWTSGVGFTRDGTESMVK